MSEPFQKRGDSQNFKPEQPASSEAEPLGFGEARLSRAPASVYETPGEKKLHELELKYAQQHHEKPPAPHWSQSETIGPPAQTAAGNDMEARALAIMGKQVDDGLGSEACMHSISKHVLDPHLQAIGLLAPVFDSTVNFTAYAQAHPDLFSVETVPQRELSAGQLQPGDIVIGNKSDGNHAMIAARLPASWGGSAESLALLGNTGHPELVPDGPNGPHFRIQEFIGTPADEMRFGTHHGGPESDSPANPYNLRGAHWTIIRLKR